MRLTEHIVSPMADSVLTNPSSNWDKALTVYPKKYAHGFCFAVLCCGYTLTDFPISIRLTSLALWQSNDCPSASKATLMNMDKYFMWIHCERLHNHNNAKHNKSCAYFLGYTVGARRMLATNRCGRSAGISAHLYRRACRKSPKPWGGHPSLWLQAQIRPKCSMGLQSGEFPDCFTIVYLITYLCPEPRWV